MLDLVFDMETRDPDDVLTLCLLATHPRVTLRAVTVNPGTRAQLGVVRHVLGRLDRGDVLVGARNPDGPGDHVSAFHTAWLGSRPGGEPDDVAAALLADTFRAHPETVLLTGAPLHNLRLLLNRHPDVALSRWVAQGGFAGDNVVPPEHRLSKFAGLRTCLTFNFNGDAKGARLALASTRIGSRDLVSKNVTHGVSYDVAFHRSMAGYRQRTRGLALLYEAMDCYLRERPEGKMLHDPIAACAAIDRDIATWAEVEVVREEGRWGSRPAVGTRTNITIALDRERFFQVFVAG